MREQFVKMLEGVRTTIRDSPEELEVKSAVAKGRRGVRGERAEAMSDSLRVAKLEVSYSSVEITLAKKLREKLEKDTLEINAVLVWERNPPMGEEKIEWILLTSLPVSTDVEAEHIVKIYRERWGIENFHKMLKSGC